MPCHSYSIPAKDCQVGNALHQVSGSVCEDCYALKGNYRFGNVERAMQKRFEALSHPYWVDAMVLMIEATRNRYFRWHDSGDLQSLEHLTSIAQIAIRLPRVKFWLPTREKKYVNAYLRKFGDFPDNLIVRVSSAMVDGPPPAGYPQTSTVVSSGHDCPAPEQGNKCLDCRRCWDKSVANVALLKH